MCRGNNVARAFNSDAYNDVYTSSYASTAYNLYAYNGNKPYASAITTSNPNPNACDAYRPYEAETGNFIQGWATKPGDQAFIEEKGTNYFQDLSRCLLNQPESSWQEVLEEVGRTVSRKVVPVEVQHYRSKMSYRSPMFDSVRAKQEPVHHFNCPWKIPLKDVGEITFF